MSAGITLFTLAEANQLIAELRPIVSRLRELKAEHDRVRDRVELLGVASSGAAPGNPDRVSLAAEEERLEKLAKGIAVGVARVHRHGCLVKDLDQGLVDFYALSGDRLVFLCWRLGEPEVAHWHTLEGGFAGRRPLKNAERE
jgi:hypothetical protein